MIYQGKLEYVIVDRKGVDSYLLDLRSGEVENRSLAQCLDTKDWVEALAYRLHDKKIIDHCMLVTDDAVIYEQWRKSGFQVVPIGMGVVDYSPYVLEELEDHTAESLESIFLRLKGLPWHIAKTDRLLIREITLADVPKLYDIYSDPRVSEYVDPLYEDINEELEYTAKYIENCYGFYEYGTWILESTLTGEIVGRAGLEPLDDRTELGYVIAGDYQGQGLATEACTCIMEMAKELIPGESLWARCNVNNHASQKILTKFGFVEIKEKREADVLWYTSN